MLVKIDKRKTFTKSHRWEKSVHYSLKEGSSRTWVKVKVPTPHHDLTGVHYRQVVTGLIAN